jgi:hypothetical protein
VKNEEDDLFETEGDDDVPIRTFTASYESTCPCGALILEGDSAGYIGDDDEASCGPCILSATL